MKYCKLGKTDISISRVTHGCMELGGGRWKTLDKESNSALLKTALENGITTFDTAEGYGAGASELIVGEALKDRRKDCVIATKVLPDNLRAADVRKAAADIVNGCTFDNNLPCIAEKEIVAVDSVADELMNYMISEQGCYLISKEEQDKLTATVITPKGTEPEMRGKGCQNTSFHDRHSGVGKYPLHRF